MTSKALLVRMNCVLTVMWKSELVSDELAYLAEDISKVLKVRSGLYLLFIVKFDKK